MTIEIERKFLVLGDGWRGHAHAVVPMAQGHLNDQATMDLGRQRASMRVRIAGDAACLNIESRELGCRRQGFDYYNPALATRPFSRWSDDEPVAHDADGGVTAC